MRRVIQMIGFATLAIFVTLQSVTAQEEPAVTAQEEPEDVEVIETNVGLDQILGKRGSPDAVSFEKSDRNFGTLSEVAIEREEIIRANRALKRLIEENEELRTRRNQLMTELRRMRGQRRIEANRLSTVTEEMRKVRNQIESITQLNQSNAQRIYDLTNALSTRDAEHELKMKEMQEKLTKYKEKVPDAMLAVTTTVVPKFNSADVMKLVNDYNQEKKQLKADSAKIHYNMGNIYFQRGEYKKAVKKYHEVVNLMPSDSSAHFNLAFVSAEYLGDHEIAMKHYREYLLLNPYADDAPLVKEKILESKLQLRGRIESPLDTKAERVRAMR